MIREPVTKIGEYTLPQYRHRIKLNQNENPFELPETIKRDILERTLRLSWSRYPPFFPSDQTGRVARFAGWKEEGTLLGNGSNDLLQLLFTCVLEGGRTVVLSQPTFTLYALLARALGAEVAEVPMGPGFQFDTDRIIETATRTRASLVMLCSPNNPTGTCLTEGELRRVLESTDAIVALDEAYVHFAGSSSVTLLEEYDRLVILQTFSKAMGAAGLRFGYLLAQPALAAPLGRVKLPYSVNVFTLTAVDVLTERWQEYRPWIDAIIRERGRMLEALRQTEGVQVYPSGANFLLFEVLRKSPGEVFRGILDRGILIRDVSSYPGLARGLRVTIGLPGEDDEFLAALREVA